MDDPSETLRQRLASVNEWLRFAETKNGGITALSSLAATATLNYLSDLIDPPTLECWGLGTSCLLFVASVGLAVLSFFPQTEPNKLTRVRDKKPTPDANPYFFGDLATMSASTLAEEVLRRAEVVDRVPTIEEIQIAEQVVINSQITMYKLSMFSWAVRAFLAAVVLATFSVLVDRMV